MVAELHLLPNTNYEHPLTYKLATAECVRLFTVNYAKKSGDLEQKGERGGDQSKKNWARREMGVDA